MMKCLWIWQCNDNYTQISPLYIQEGHNNDEMSVDMAV